MVDVTVRQERVLDLVALGPTYHELGLSWSAAGHPPAARDAFLRAIGYDLAAKHTRALARDYLELGRCLSRLREHDAALAAFDRSLDLSFEVDDPAFEFQVLTDVASISARAGHRRDAIPEVLGRLYDMLDERPDVLSKSLLERFARMTRDVMLGGRVDTLRTRSVGSPRPRLIGDAGARALDQLVPERRWWDFEPLLAGRLGDGLPRRSVPEPGDLCRFLLLYTGDTFKSGHYTREFGLSQERAKRHLRWLCANGIIEREGNRKAARYSLAFHRQAQETRDSLAKAT